MTHWWERNTVGELLPYLRMSWGGPPAYWLDFPGPPIQTHGSAVGLSWRGLDLERLHVTIPTLKKRKENGV